MGFGVGPRVTWDQHRQQVRAVRVGVTEGQNEGEDEEARKHMYPRRDTPLLLVPRKDNSHGLGYTPGMGLNASLGVTGGKESTKGSRISCLFLFLPFLPVGLLSSSLCSGIWSGRSQ